MLMWTVNFQKRDALCSFPKKQKPEKPHLQGAFISEHLLLSVQNHAPLNTIQNTSLPCTVGEGLLVGWRKGSLEALAVFRKEPSKSWPDGLAGAPNGSKVAPRKQEEKSISLSYEFTHSTTEELSLLQGRRPNTWKIRMMPASQAVLQTHPSLITSSRVNNGSQGFLTTRE